MLGIPENASAADVRADYIERDNDDQVRDEVTNRRRVLHAHARYDQRIADEVAREDKRRDAQVKDAWTRPRTTCRPRSTPRTPIGRSSAPS